MKIYKSEQSGRSMVEMLGVLAIIGVLSVAGIAGYSKAMAKYKLSKTTDQVSMIVANIRTLYSGQRNYSGLATDSVVSFGVIPSEMVNGDKVMNAFAGEVTFGTSPVNNVADLAFTVKFAGLNRDACVSLASADWGSDSSSGLVSIQVGSQAALSGSNLPVSLANAAAGCDCGSNATCSIEWTYL
ncbi:MAG: hypothetical protein LBL47_00780 [Lactobacillus sp.]|jgi:type II secretory pathway pseudopilin PulG|nr:hypothetical protein [Lactobacillus sp.]